MSQRRETYGEGTQLKYEFSDMQGPRRLRELILYISAQCADDPNFASVKLNKLLYFSDFLSFRRRGVPITGMAYQALPLGPAPVAMMPITREMEADGEVEIANLPFYGYTQKRYMPKRESNIGIFSAGDLAIVDEVIQNYRDENAGTISELSHGRAWQIARQVEGNKIPYNAAWISDRPITKRDLERTREALRRMDEFYERNLEF